ncbi:MAG: helix-turn-helix family protein [Firmicutes bacterium]|nr:helix-turn-helix family protein [Bacillota bacterium]
MNITDENQELGSRVAKVRTGQKLTLRQLADQIDVSASLLSQIEKGRISPSLATLRAIAQALNVPLFTFFLEETPADTLVVRAGTGKKITVPDLNLEYSLLTPDLSGAIEMALLKVPPNCSSSDVLLAHSGEEVAYVSSGEVFLLLDEQTVHLGPGDSVKILPNTRHKWQNKTDKEAVVIFALTPPTF